MNWEECRYKDIAEKFSDDDIIKLTDAMILNNDNCGKYYETHQVVDLIKDCVSNSSEILSLVQEAAQREVNKMEKDDTSSLVWEMEDLEGLNVMLRKKDILNSILTIIEKVAIKKKEERYFLRLQEGDSVDFNSCDSYNPLKDVIEFYKDGGWGIADKNGRVLVKNHITEKPSALPFRSFLNVNYRIIQDRDTGFYGVLSLKSLNEPIHCLYDNIEAIEYWIEHRKNYILKVKKNGKWGCYNENCSLIIECQYDDIRIVSDLIECGRDGDFLYPESSYQKQEKIYDGTKDLYDLYGHLLLGGYDYFDVYEYIYNKRFLFYFGTKYNEFYVKENDIFDNEIKYVQYQVNFEKALCLILDNHFNTLLKYNGNSIKLPYGKVFRSIQELKSIIPNDLLLSGMIDLSDLDMYSLIYLKKKDGDKYLMSNYYPAIPECIIEGGVPERWDDFLIEDNEVIIAKIENGMISRRFRVNEIAKTDSGLLLFRNGERVGFYSQSGVTAAIYSAVTIESQDNEIYVAQITLGILKSDINKWNPNFIPHMGYTIQYYELLEDGTLVKLQDDWKIFCPKDYNWFPFNFKSKNGLIDEIYDDYSYHEGGRSYEEYGGYNGYDDDTIDDAFDGFPEATWNID